MCDAYLRRKFKENKVHAIYKRAKKNEKFDMKPSNDLRPPLNVNNIYYSTTIHDNFY